MTQALRAPATGTRTARAASGGARATATSAQANPSGANASAASSLPVATALQISDVAITSRRAINASATAWIGAVSSRWQRSSRSAACDSASSKLASACAAAQRCRQSLERAAARRSRDGVTAQRRSISLLLTPGRSSYVGAAAAPRVLSSSKKRHLAPPGPRQLPANLGCELKHVDGHALPHPIRRLHLRERGLARAKVCFALEQGKGHHAPAISIDEHRQPALP